MVDEEVTKVICPLCCAHMGPAITKPSAQVQSNGPKKPKGWHFMKVFVDSEGNVFHEGEEQPTLKGTLEATKVEVKPKKSKFQREQERQQKEAKDRERYEQKKAKLIAAEEKKAAKKGAIVEESGVE